MDSLPIEAHTIKGVSEGMGAYPEDSRHGLLSVSMRKVAFFLTLTVLLVPLAGCTTEKEDIDATISVTGVEVVEERDSGAGPRNCGDDGRAIGGNIVVYECHILTVEIDNNASENFSLHYTSWEGVTTNGTDHRSNRANWINTLNKEADRCSAGSVCTVEIYFTLKEGVTIEKLRLHLGYEYNDLETII